jgi:hypothetical protein
MAKARLVVADVGSTELDQLRRSVNALFVVLQNIASEVDAASITADEAFTVILNSLSTGVDSSITGVDGGANNYAGTQREVVGTKPTPSQPMPPRGGIANMLASDKF